MIRDLDRKSCPLWFWPEPDPFPWHSILPTSFSPPQPLPTHTMHRQKGPNSCNPFITTMTAPLGENPSPQQTRPRPHVCMHAPNVHSKWRHYPCKSRHDPTGLCVHTHVFLYAPRISWNRLYEIQREAQVPPAGLLLLSGPNTHLCDFLYMCFVSTHTLQGVFRDEERTFI